MDQPLIDLYRARDYPAMSHPVADPAVNFVAARLVGLQAVSPGNARVLEIGCASGHHLLPLAGRWPSARFTGIDFSGRAIRRARVLAEEAGFSNVDFHECALEAFTADDGPYDYIIAHGFFSWVPDEVKARLLSFCRDHLGANGLAVISFNVEAGWRSRRPLIEKSRAIQQFGGVDEMAALELLKSVTKAPADLAIIDDMLAKGPGILPFDDFAPVNDAWPLDRFVMAAEKSGMRWLGESVASNNRPPDWAAEDEAEATRCFKNRPLLELHQWMDERSMRTFRAAMLCRADAALQARISTEVALDFELRPAGAPPGPMAARIHETLTDRGHSSVPAKQVVDALAEFGKKEIAREIFHGIADGWLDARCHALRVPSQVLRFPEMNALRLACARRELPIVDALHRPCAFPETDYAILSLMDGSLVLEELKARAAVLSPHLDFDRWIDHLNARGMFEMDSETCRAAGMDQGAASSV